MNSFRLIVEFRERMMGQECAEGGDGTGCSRFWRLEMMQRGAEALARWSMIEIRSATVCGSGSASFVGVGGSGRRWTSGSHCSRVKAMRSGAFEETQKIQVRPWWCDARVAARTG